MNLEKLIAHALPKTLEQNIKWQRQFLPHMKGVWMEVLAEHKVTDITEAPFKNDYYRETDMFAAMESGLLRLANRVRSFHHYMSNRGDFTLRNCGWTTELQRIVDLKYGDYYLYAFANIEETDLAAWVVLDLDVFREEYKSTVEAIAMGLKDQRRIEWTEGDPEEGEPFIAFKLETFVPEIVVASHNHNRLPKETK